MRMLVLGAGLQGAACAWDLLRSKGITHVTIADLHTDKLPAFLKASRSERLKVAQLDVNDHAAVRVLMQDHDAAMSALPYYFNGHMAALAVEGNCHFSDLGGNTEIVLEQKKLHDRARACGVSVIPDCGLAPGMVNIIAAEGIRRIGDAQSVKIFVGGLPQHPEPPL
ncbi:MAG: saccharopine dehydrogenase family protein, partial [Gemmatimonadales bacterium]